MLHFNRPARLFISLAVLIVLLNQLWSVPAVQAQSNRMQRISYGEVVSMQSVTVQNRPSGRGGRTGGTVGAIAGAALADRGDGLLGALIGGAIGSAIGRGSDRRKSVIKGKELIIRLESGEEVLIETTDGVKYFKGDSVQLISGSNGTRVRRVRR